MSLHRDLHNSEVDGRMLAAMRFTKCAACLLLVFPSTFLCGQSDAVKSVASPAVAEGKVGGTGPTVDTLSADSKELEALKIKKPVYPMEAIQRGIQGQVWVRVYVTETGDVAKVEELRGDPLLSKAAVDAVKNWKFKPFIRNGKAVKVSSDLPVDFAFAENVSEASLPAKTKYPDALPVSQGVQQGMLTHRVQPVYPMDARRHHVEGTVVLSAVIGKDGRIHELVPLAGPKELVEAAKAAVEQWRYKPYLLKNEPVDVRTQITVNFILQ